MGLKSHAVKITGILELLDANDEPMLGDDGQRMTIEMFGPGSEEHAKAQSIINNRAIEKLKRKKVNQSADEALKENADYLARCTRRMSDNMATDYKDEQGNVLQGRELHIAVYSDREVGFVADQAMAFLKDWGNFTKSSTKTSAST